MSGEERLVLSGSVVNPVFFAKAFELADRAAPRVLLDFSAAPTREAYQYERAIYGEYLSKICTRPPSFLQDEAGRQKSNRAVGQLLRQADILFVSGGSTRKLLRRWTDYTQQAVAEHVQAGDVVGSGTSAGALVWFQTGHSDSRQYEFRPGTSWRYVPIAGLGIIDAWATVHHHDHDAMGRLRSKAFADSLKWQSGEWGQALGISSNAALVCANGLASVLEVKPARRFEPPADITLYRPGQSPVAFRDGETVPLI